MPGYAGRRDFRANRGLIVASVLSGPIFAAGTVMTYRLQGWTWVSIALAEEARGSPTAILLKTGRWVKLPAVGSDLGNSIRAWLRHHT